MSRNAKRFAALPEIEGPRTSDTEDADDTRDTRTPGLSTGIRVKPDGAHPGRPASRNRDALTASKQMPAKKQAISRLPASTAADASGPWAGQLPRAVRLSERFEWRHHDLVRSEPMRVESSIMTCRELTEFIADYLSGELSPDTRQSFEHHLSVCPNCVNYLASYKAAIELGRGALAVDETDVPDDLVRAILNSRKPS
jgi:putative zinc finger protein